jgi:hypothetical protein
MGVRLATVDDLPRLVDIFLQFYVADGRPLSNGTPVAGFCLDHIRTPNKICIVAGEPIGAFLTGAVQPHFHTGIMTAIKTVWLSAPGKSGYGASLIRPFEDWAKARGATRIIFSGRDDRTQRLLRLKGYQSLETAYDKELT